MKPFIHPLFHARLSIAAPAESLSPDADLAVISESVDKFEKPIILWANRNQRLMATDNFDIVQVSGPGDSSSGFWIRHKTLKGMHAYNHSGFGGFRAMDKALEDPKVLPAIKRKICQKYEYYESDTNRRPLSWTSQGQAPA